VDAPEVLLVYHDRSHPDMEDQDIPLNRHGGKVKDPMILDLSKLTVGRTELVYELCGVLSGTDGPPGGSGHAITMARGPQGTWHSFDDDDVEPTTVADFDAMQRDTSPEDYKNYKPCIIAFTRVDSHGKKSVSLESNVKENGVSQLKRKRQEPSSQSFDPPSKIQPVLRLRKPAAAAAAGRSSLTTTAIDVGFTEDIGEAVLTAWLNLRPSDDEEAPVTVSSQRVDDSSKTVRVNCLYHLNGQTWSGEFHGEVEVTDRPFQNPHDYTEGSPVEGVTPPPMSLAASPVVEGSEGAQLSVPMAVVVKGFEGSADRQAEDDSGVDYWDSR